MNDSGHINGTQSMSDTKLATDFSIGGIPMVAAVGPYARSARWRHGLLTAAFAVASIGAVASSLANVQPSMSMLNTAIILVAIFLAALVSSIAGFAFSALAGAVLIHLYDEPAEMVRVMLVCSIAVQLYCSARILKEVQWRTVAPYLIGGMATLPLGVAILKWTSSDAYAVIIGAILLGYAVYALSSPLKLGTRQRPGLDVCVGALGGLTGGLAAFPGAFPVMWCAARGLAKERQRAICQPYILVMQIAALGWLQYAYDAKVLDLAKLWVFVPVALLAASLGFSIFQRISIQQFKTIVLVLLAFSGVMLVGKGW